MSARRPILFCLGACLALADPAGAGDAPIRLDAYGDPLPAGALARLGTARFRRGEAVHAVAYSPDGNVLAGACQDRTVRLWDAATGRELHRFYVGLRADGRAAPEKPFFRPAVALAPDGKTLAGTAADGTVRLWRVATGKEVRRLGGRAGTTNAVAFAPDGAALAAGGRDGTVYLWAVATAGDWRALRGHGEEITALAFAPRENILASGDRGGTVLLWDAGTGRRLRRLPKQKGSIIGLVWSPDGRLLVSLPGMGADGRWEGMSRVWEAATGRELHRLQSSTSAAFAPDGKTLFLGGGFLRAWDVVAGKEKLQWGAPNQYWYGSVTVSPDGKSLAAGVAGGVLIHPLPLNYYASVRRLGCTAPALRHVAFAPDGKTLFTAPGDSPPNPGSLDEGVRRWRSDAGQECGRFTARERVTALALSPDGRFLATAGEDNAVRLRDPVTGKELRGLEDRCRNIAALTFSPDGKRLAAGGRDGTVHVWETATGMILRRLPHPAAVLSLAFSGDGATLAAVGAPIGQRLLPVSTGNLEVGQTGTEAAVETVRLWDLGTGKEVRRLRQPGAGTVAFSADGRPLALGGSAKEYGVLCLWDLDSGRPPRTFRGDQHGIQTLALSPDGRSLASGSHDASGMGDMTVRLWEVATGQERCRFQGHTGFVDGLAFSADGRLLASASEDGTAVVWDVAGLGLKKPGAAPDAARLKALWYDLGRPDAPAAYRAMRELAAAPARAVPFLRSRLRPVPPVDAARLAGLVAALDDKHFATRQRATRELEQLGEAAEADLERLRRRPPSLEAGRRAEQLLARLRRLREPVPAPERLSALRALEVLEWIGDAESRRLLDTLARGAPGAWLTGETRASLRRLARQRE